MHGPGAMIIGLVAHFLTSCFAVSLTSNRTSVTPLPFPAKPNEWSAFEYIAGSQCMDGRETGAWLRTGTNPNKLLIFLKGGGACFNVVSCLTAGSDPTGGSPEHPPNEGIFKFDDARNPVRDHTVVWIPYCSGDVHTGNRRSTVPSVGAKTFMGRSNLALLFERLVPSLPDITDLVITGESAGGFGAIASFDFMMEAFSKIKFKSVTMIDDCGPMMHDDYLAPCLQKQWRGLWGLDDAIPVGCPQCTLPTGGGLWNSYEYLQTKYPTANFGLIESANDQAIALFFGFGRDQCQATGPGLLPNFEQGLQDVFHNYLGPRWATMFFAGTRHTYIARESFYLEMHQGIYVHDWFEAVLNGNFMKITPW